MIKMLFYQNILIMGIPITVKTGHILILKKCPWNNTSAPVQSMTRASFNSLRPSDAYICVGKLTIIGSDNGLSPGRRQAIIWTNAGILLIRPRETNFSEIFIEIYTFSFNKMHLKMSSAKWRLFRLCLNGLIYSLSRYSDFHYKNGTISSLKW